MRKMLVRLGAFGVLVGGVSLAMAATAQAQEYCVVCNDPGAIYRCILKNAGPARTQPLKVACITALARAGRHASCAVRGGTVFDCVGPLTKVDATTGEVEGAPPAQGTATATTAPQPIAGAAPVPPKKQTSSDTPPATVEEAIKRATSSTVDTVSQAGRSISSGAKKSWTCVTSLFKSCGAGSGSSQ
ncbi:MAG: hypothetical protein R3D68_18025 [Hyphomicrobiaceae bacterium]